MAIQHGDGALKEQPPHQHADSPTPFHHQLHHEHHSNLLKHSHSHAHDRAAQSLPSFEIVNEQPNTNAISGEAASHRGHTKGARNQGSNIFSAFEAIDLDLPGQKTMTNHEAIKPESASTVYSDFELINMGMPNQNAMNNREAIKPQTGSSIFSTFELLDLDPNVLTQPSNDSAIKPKK